MKMLATLLRVLFPFAHRQSESALFFRCSWCGQKLRYDARNAGRSPPCPRCHRPCTIPTEPPPIENEGRGTFRVGRRDGPTSRQSA
jgi:hypothetical protein